MARKRTKLAYVDFSAYLGHYSLVVAGLTIAREGENCYAYPNQARWEWVTLTKAARAINSKAAAIKRGPKVTGLEGVYRAPDFERTGRDI